MTGFLFFQSISINPVARRNQICQQRSFWFLASFRLSDRVFKPAPSPKPRQQSKIPAPPRYIISVNAPASTTAGGKIKPTPSKAAPRTSRYQRTITSVSRQTTLHASRRPRKTIIVLYNVDTETISKPGPSPQENAKQDRPLTTDYGTKRPRTGEKKRSDVGDRRSEDPFEDNFKTRAIAARERKERKARRTMDYETTDHGPKDQGQGKRRGQRSEIRGRKRICGLRGFKLTSDLG